MKRDPKVRCFDVMFGGGSRPSVEREGQTFWPHAIDIRFGHAVDVENMVMQGIRWLRENGAKPAAEREAFTIQTMGEIMETDPDTGKFLGKKL